MSSLSEEFKLENTYMNRVVDDKNRFLEKLQIIDAGLDDRVIELMKLLLLVSLQKNNPDLEIIELLFSFNYNGGRSFAIRLKDNQWGETAFHQDMYDYIETSFKETLENDKEVLINQDWALNIFSQREK